MVSIASLLVAAMFSGCTAAHRLSLREMDAQLCPMSSLRADSTRYAPPPQDSLGQFQHDSTRFFLLRRDTVGGISEGTLEISGITVVTRSRTVVERAGRVEISFSVTFPRELLGRCQEVEVTPCLLLRDRDSLLGRLIIRGDRLDLLQQREYWQFETFLSRFSREGGEQAAFRRFVRFPRVGEALLERTIRETGDVEYHARHVIPLRDSLRSLRLTLQGRVRAMDSSVYTLPAKDTLQFFISTLGSLMDLTPRKKIRIVERRQYLQGDFFISYPAGRADLDTLVGNNLRELRSLDSLLRVAFAHGRMRVDSILLRSFASPEGEYRLNARLSRQRTRSVRSFIGALWGEQADTLVCELPGGENTEGVLRALDTIVHPHSQPLSRILLSERDPDRAERLMRQRSTELYSRLRHSIYPRLRYTQMRIAMHDPTLKKDTLHLSETDSTYMHALELMRMHRYREALWVIAPYGDLNAAICALQSGQCALAWQILEGLPCTASTEYLKAIVCSRRGELGRGREHLQRAISLNPRLEFRAKLDPETHELLKNP